MNWLKIGAAAFGVAVTLLAASPHANATVIDSSIRTSFNEGRTLFDASAGPASKTISTNVGADRVIEGVVQVDATDIQLWWKRRHGQSRRQARRETADAWTFTLSHAGKTVDLGGLPGPVKDHWFKTSAFDGLTAGGDWVLTATSDYYRRAKRMIEFNLAGFFFTKVSQTNPPGGGGGQVPAPAPLLLILAGLAGMAGMRRKA